MADEGLPTPVEVRSFLAESLSGQSPRAPQELTRRDTMSTISSAKTLPPGVWKIPVHGNCPWCNYSHRAAEIRYRVSTNPKDVSNAHCEHCNQKWLVLGGRKTTQISLMADPTIDLDDVEIDVRKELIRMVRSVTAFASPSALPIIPESSRGPSRQGSVRTPVRDVGRDLPPSGTNCGPPKSEEEPHGSDDAQAPPLSSTLPAQKSNRTTSRSNSRRAWWALSDLKRKLKNRFPVLERVHIRQRLTLSREGKDPAKEKGKTSVGHGQGAQAVPPRVDNTSNTQKPQQDLRNQHIAQKSTSCVKACTPERSAGELLNELKDLDPENLKKMEREDRIIWMQEQVSSTTFRCARTCSCRLNCSPSPPMVDSSTQIDELPPICPGELRRTPSADYFLGIGSGFDSSVVGTQFPHTGDLSISNDTTRTSDADTAVEGNTGTLSARRSWVMEFVHHQRHRSRSPRPASLLNSRHSLQYLQHNGIEPRSSMDSIVAGGAGRSVSVAGRRGRTDRYSAASLAAPSLSPGATSPLARTATQESMPGEAGISEADTAGSHAQRESRQSTHEEEESPDALSEPPRASTPRLNGYRTDDERNHDSDTTPPA